MTENELQELIRKAESGIAEAQYELGCYYRDFAEEKVEYFKSMIVSGNRGFYCRKGESVPRDSFSKVVEEERKNAFYWFLQSANQGHLAALYELSLCYANGTGTAPYPEKAQELLLEAAEKGFVPAQGDIGVQFYFGKRNPLNGIVEIKQDFHKAVEWLTKAAEGDDATAQYFLAMCYENGEGVPVDLTMARRLYERAAELGSMNAAEALDRLGV